MQNHVKNRWAAILNSLIAAGMLFISGWLLLNGGYMSLHLLSNPNLDIATELVRLFWGIVGTAYFAYFLIQSLREL